MPRDLSSDVVAEVYTLESEGQKRLMRVKWRQKRERIECQALQQLSPRVEADPGQGHFES